MSPDEFNALVRRQQTSLLTLVWPEIERRLQSGMTPEAIASQMALEGYWGFTSSRIGVGDIHRLWTLAIERGKSATSSS